MNKVAIFDWGGVIMRTFDRGGRDKWQNRLGLPQWGVDRVVHGSDAWNEVQVGKRDLDSYWEIVAEELGISKEEIPEFRADFYGGDRLDEDVLTVIRLLKAEGIPVGLMSNNSLHLVNLLEEYDLADLFDAVVISAQIGVMKPAPEAFRAILNEMNVEASQSVFIDDFASNVEGAQAVGMHAIHFQGGMDLRAAVDEFLNHDA